MAYHVIATDEALRAMCDYHKRSLECRERLDRLVDRMIAADLQGTVARVQNARRALWRLDLDPETFVYTTVSRRNGEDEYRIVHFGSAPKDLA